MAEDMIARMMAMGVRMENLVNVSIQNPKKGDVLKYDSDQGKWVNGTAGGTVFTTRPITTAKAYGHFQVPSNTPCGIATKEE